MSNVSPRVIDGVGLVYSPEDLYCKNFDSKYGPGYFEREHAEKQEALKSTPPVITNLELSDKSIAAIGQYAVDALQESLKSLLVDNLKLLGLDPKFSRPKCEKSVKINFENCKLHMPEGLMTANDFIRLVYPQVPTPEKWIVIKIAPYGNSSYHMDDPLYCFEGDTFKARYIKAFVLEEPGV